jgi:predicted outer membrane repeat protein
MDIATHLIHGVQALPTNGTIKPPGVVPGIPGSLLTLTSPEPVHVLMSMPVLRFVRIGAPWATSSQSFISTILTVAGHVQLTLQQGNLAEDNDHVVLAAVGHASVRLEGNTSVASADGPVLFATDHGKISLVEGSAVMGGENYCGGVVLHKSAALWLDSGSSVQGIRVLKTSSCSSPVVKHNKVHCIGAYDSTSVVLQGGSYVSECEMEGLRGGGGLGLYDNATAFIENSSIVNNTAGADGGGVLLSGQSVLVSQGEVHICANKAGYSGGALHLKGRSQVHALAGPNGVLDLADNVASAGFGGAVSVTEDAQVIIGSSSGLESMVTVRRTVAVQGGGFASADKSTAWLQGCRLEGNQARDMGGAISASGDAVIIARNKATITGNSAGNGGAAVSLTGAASFDAMDVMVMGNVRLLGSIGAIFADQRARVVLVNTTISGNGFNNTRQFHEALQKVQDGLDARLDAQLYSATDIQVHGSTHLVIRGGMVTCSSPRYYQPGFADYRFPRVAQVELPCNIAGGVPFGVSCFRLSGDAVLEFANVSGIYFAYVGGFPHAAHIRALKSLGTGAHGLIDKVEGYVQEPDKTYLVLASRSGTNDGLLSGIVVRWMRCYMLNLANSSSNNALDMPNACGSLQATGNGTGAPLLWENLLGPMAGQLVRMELLGFPTAGAKQLLGTALVGSDGLAWFNSIKLQLPPGTYQLSFLHGASGTDILANITVSIRSCILGETTNMNGTTCDPCGPNEYSFSNDSMACTRPCPVAATCPGGAVVVPGLGFWHSGPSSAEIHRQVWLR